MYHGTRLTYLIFALCFLIGLVMLPSLAEKISYSVNKGAEKAMREEALAFLKEFPIKEKIIPWVVKAVGPSVVGIKVQRNGQISLGSGVIVDKKGDIITNFHVLGDSQSTIEAIEIHFSDDRIISSGISLVGCSPENDLALLRIETLDLTAIGWGDSDQMEVGEEVLAIGNPYGLEHTVTSGILSAKKRYNASNMSKIVVQEFLQTDAPINPGNSGGALVNIRGELVGINTAIVGESYLGIGFAIPSNYVRKVYQELLKQEGRITP